MTEAWSFTLLGTGSSGGVPRLGPDWGACDPNQPRNRRMRCSALLEWGSEQDALTRVLIDTSPDLREQCLHAGITQLDAVLFTHDHADQCHGIDDLRLIAHCMRARIPVHMMAETRERMVRSFGYCFAGHETGGYPAIIEAREDLIIGQSIGISGAGGTVDILSLEQDHGAMTSLGFRVGGLAYCNDVVRLPNSTMAELSGVEVFIVDALRYTPHPTHAHLERALDWSRQIGAEHTILTNLHIDMDYQTLLKELPDGVIPAYDGLEVSRTVDGEITYADRYARVRRTTQF